MLNFSVAPMLPIVPPTNTAGGGHGDDVFVAVIAESHAADVQGQQPLELRPESTVIYRNHVYLHRVPGIRQPLEYSYIPVWVQYCCFVTGPSHSHVSARSDVHYEVPTCN